MPIENIEQAQFLVDLRVKIQANKDAGRPEYHGIDRDEIQKVISILRGNRAAIAEKTSKKGSKKVTAVSDDELKNLFS